MSFAERLSEQRKKKGISQEVLAEKLGTKGPAIGRYERGVAKPTIEVAAKIASILEVSLDYLVGISNQEVDTKLLKLITDLQSLSTEHQEHIIKTIQSLVRDAKANEVYG